MADRTTACTTCGVAFPTPGSRGFPRRECFTCRPPRPARGTVSKPGQFGRTLAELACMICGRGFRPRFSRQLTCSRECGFAWQRLLRPPKPRPKLPALRELTCVQCGGPFIGTRRHRLCSEDCRRARRNRLAAREHPLITLRCAECSTPFTYQRYNLTRLFCNEQCLATRNPEAERASKRAQNQRRRARKQGVVSERIDARLIFERDRWVCGICGDAVDSSLRFPHPLSASLDHILPLARGGPHTRANVQTAHLICNSLKRDVVITEPQYVQLGMPV